MYCTVDDVRSEIRGSKISNSSVLTEDKVTTFIRQASNLIDAKINKRYSVPVEQVSSPKSFDILNAICRHMVIARCRALLNVQTPNENTSNFTGGGMKVSKDLMNVEVGKIDLIDAVPASDPQTVYFEFNNKPIFKDNKDNW